MAMAPTISIAVATLSAVAVEGFQSFSSSIITRRSTHQHHHHGPRTSSSPKSQITIATSTSLLQSSSSTSSNDQIATSDIQLLFTLLADSTLLYDPSRGTCCRNQCSGCSYLDPSNGNFIYDEYTTDDDGDEVEFGGWLAPYVKVDFGTRLHISTWSKILLPSTWKVERHQFASLLGEKAHNVVSPLALQSLWNVLSPSPGYPQLSSSEITTAIKGMEGSVYEMGGAVDYKVFEKSMRSAADRIVELGGVVGENSNSETNSKIMDYDGMSKEELLEVVEERSMRTNFPKMKRFIIEELRFFDANGRQGTRHPVKNTLS